MDSLPAEPQGKPKNTGVGSLSLLQGIFPTQEIKPGSQVDSLPTELSGKPPDQIDRDSNPSSSLSRTVDLEQIIIPSKLYFFLTVKWGNDVYPRELSGLLEIKYVTSQHRVSIQETVVHLLT